MLTMITVELNRMLTIHDRTAQAFLGLDTLSSKNADWSVFGNNRAWVVSHISGFVTSINSED